MTQIDYVTNFSLLLALGGIINAISLLIDGRDDRGWTHILSMVFAYTSFVASSAYVINYALNIIITNLKP